MLLSSLDTGTLLRHAYAEISELTSTPLELELLRRLEAEQDSTSFMAVIEDHGIETAEDLAKALALHADFNHLDVRALLDVLLAEGIDDAPALKARLALADEFQAIANDAGDVFARLNSLATKE